MRVIKLKNVSKYYYSKGVIAPGFTKVSLNFNLGEFVAITGESGSGKSTLINVISGLDSYEDGEMYINGKETSHYISKDWEIYRKKYIGNIYQNFNLINSYTVYQNIDLVLTLNGASPGFRRKKVLDLIKKVGLTKFKNTKVSKLSGGQKQRVSIARALAKDVPIIVADEPTGNLDKKSSESIIKLLSEVAKDKLVIIVTHNYDQVEEYVTRKIVMHDGKILEDKKVKEKEKVGIARYPVSKSITFIDTIRLAIRNTFNILPKFLLLFLIYLFIVVALMTEYGAFKAGEKNLDSYSTMFFAKLDEKRIVVNKEDRSGFTDIDFKNIESINNIDRIVKNDLLIDNKISIISDNNYFWFDSFIMDANLIDEVDKGRLPEAPNEIVIEGPADDYYLTKELKTLYETVFYLYDDNTFDVDKSVELKVVGVKYADSEKFVEDSIYNIYVGEDVSNKLKFDINKIYSKVKINFMASYHDSGTGNEFRISTDSNVPKGQAFISDSYNSYCFNENCVGSQFSIEVSNIYYSDSLYLTISKIYNKDTINRIVNVPDYNRSLYEDNYEGIMYINPDDYNSLFEKNTYQISVYVNDETKIDEVVDNLNSFGFKTYKLSELGVDNTSGRIIRVVKIVVTIVVVVILFFISYFIIKLILRSRNTYYAIIRMLGGSKYVVNKLISIELFIIANISYFLYLLGVKSHEAEIINIGLFNDVSKYFSVIDYVIIYILIILMSFLLSQKYASWLFKDTAMNIYREGE